VRFSQKTDYALRALIELGGSDCFVSCRAIAERQKIPERFCEQVLTDLRKAGIIASQRGAAGGVKLLRDASGLTVSEIVELLEGPVVTQACLDPFDDDARTQAHSALQELWLDVQITIRDRLAGTTLADLVARQSELDQSSYLVFQI